MDHFRCVSFRGHGGVLLGHELSVLEDLDSFLEVVDGGRGEGSLVGDVGADAAGDGVDHSDAERLELEVQIAGVLVDCGFGGRVDA